MPTCTTAHIVIESLHVRAATEPGSYAEWYLTFNVNGQIDRWSDDYVADDKVYAVNRHFDVQLQPHTKVIISVSGYEHDGTPVNGILPTLEHEVRPDQDWQVGGVYTVASARYRITYTVTCAQSEALTREYLGVYQAGLGEHQLYVAPWDRFAAKWRELSGQGLRLARIATFRRDEAEWTFGEGIERIFMGVFSPGSDGHHLWVAPWRSFEAKWKELSGKGFRLVDLAPYEEGGTMMYAGVFREGGDRHGLWVAQWDGFQAKWREWTSIGLRLVSLDSYVADGKRFFTGVYRAGTHGHFLSAGLDWKSLRDKDQELSQTGLRLVDVASYAEHGQQRFAAVWQADRGTHPLVRQPWPEFVRDFNNRMLAGSRLIAIDTYAPISATRRTLPNGE